jgi:hypothetical protein
MDASSLDNCGVFGLQTVLIKHQIEGMLSGNGGMFGGHALIATRSGRTPMMLMTRVLL